MRIKSYNKPSLLSSIGNENYLLRWDVKEEIEGMFTYEEIRLNNPTLEKIKTLITDYYNKCCDKEILSGFTYNDVPVWLSSENQFNYKSAFDLAKQTESSNLPVKFKFGSDIETQYFVFETLEKLEDFYIKMNQFIHSTLEKNWKLKDEIDWKLYTI